MSLSQLLSVAVFALLLLESGGQCHNRCSQNGECVVGLFGAAASCDCFTGYEGPDCSRRSCASGLAWADVPTATDRAHALVECSNRGYCDYSAGYCTCEPGFEGIACERMSCPNDCSGRGECLSMATAAESFDGFHLNRSLDTVYNLWDAKKIYGCVCDPGFQGYDCSVLQCSSGDNRRTTGQRNEIVELFCQCEHSCNGSLTLTYKGEESRSFKPSSSKEVVVDRLGSLSQLYGGAGITLFESNIVATSHHSKICSREGISTTIEFARDAGDLPAIWVQYDGLQPITVHMVTNQTLTCTCSSCSGVFTLEFDGQSTAPLAHDATPAEIESALLSLSNIEEGDVRVDSSSSSSSFCASAAEPFYVVFEMAAGNQPPVKALASFWEGDSPGGSIDVTTRDGTTESGTCNDAGFCDDSTEELLPEVQNGTCHCDETWTWDGDVGSCGRPKYNTSAWTGLQRCDGWVAPTSGREPVLVLNDRFLYVTDKLNLSEAEFVFGSGINESTRYLGEPGGYVIGPVDPGDKRVTTSEQLFNMTNGSAAGVALDMGYREIYYIDQSISGVVRRRLDNFKNVTVLVSGLSSTLNGIALNLLFGERGCFLVDPGKADRVDGGIYYFSLEDRAVWSRPGFDATKVTNLTEVLNEQGIKVHSPYGIAVDPLHRLIFWTESGNTPHSVADGKVYRCNFDGTGAFVVLRSGLSEPRGIALDLRNYTMFIADSGLKAIIKADMGHALDVQPQKLAYYRNQTWYQVIITQYSSAGSTTMLGLKTPWDLVIDTTNDFLYWTDRGVGAVFRSDLNGSLGTLTIEKFYQQSDPIGIALDNGLGPMASLEAVDCYGNGYCGGPELNFKCVCNQGWLGNCNVSACPTGPAWFDQPSATNVAHAPAKCSNAGKCDLASGRCDCHAGFEGAACELMSCPRGLDSHGSLSEESCSGHGECLTLRQLGLRRTANGDDAPVRYGTPRSGNASTWDADHIQSCLCDSSGYFNGTLNNLSDWTGYDCSRRACPTGDVAFTWLNGSKKHFETQNLDCHATSGNFSLTFRRKTTDPISWDAPLSVLATKLRAIGSIGSIEVASGNTTLYGAGICTNVSWVDSNVTLTFTSELGDLPLLTADSRNLGGEDAFVTIRETTKGTKDDLSCSLHGHCDHTMGRCDCFNTYTSSNADASFGLRGDCGFVDTAVNSYY